MSVSPTAYPVHVEAELEPKLSRWLWLVKWFLVIPHYFVLAILWATDVLLSIFAFFAILFAGRYPRAMFDFNVGVLRWSWRVGYYAYGALGTDRYPPFTLADVPDYPAHLEIEYPEQLSRGLVLVKWWLLAIPHYIVVALFVGGVWAFGGEAWPAGGLIGILVFVAAVILAFTGRFPQSLFDLILGLNRWVIRVAAYAGLMTDEYPPFRLDTGGAEPNATLTVPRPDSGPVHPPATPSGKGGWTGARITSLVIGSMLIVFSLGPFVAGGLGLFFDRTQRDAAGFITVGPEQLTTSTYAITTEEADFIVEEPAWRAARVVLGDVRIRVAPRVGTKPVFVGIARRADLERYLGGVERVTPLDLKGINEYRTIHGNPPSSPPGEFTFWAASSAGSGRQSLVWDVEPGSWVAVIMNLDASSALDVHAEFAAKAPALGWVAAGLLALAVLMLVLGVVMVAIPIRNASK